MSTSGQKFVMQNRAPRVQIEYDVELYGAEKQVQLPFVMGVMSDLSGKSAEPLPAVADRKFLEIDIDNFDDRMKAIKPRAAFTVPNTLTGNGNLSVELDFERMEDFSPAAVAKKVEPLRKLLEARTQLAHLVTYMDGKTGAENLIAKLISDPSSFAAMSGLPTTGDAQASDSVEALDALDSLRLTAAAEAPAGDNVRTDAETAFEQVRQAAVETTGDDDPSETGAALDDLLRSAGPTDDEADTPETLPSNNEHTGEYEADGGNDLLFADDAVKAPEPAESGIEDDHQDLDALLADSNEHEASGIDEEPDDDPELESLLINGEGSLADQEEGPLDLDDFLGDDNGKGGTDADEEPAADAAGFDPDDSISDEDGTDDKAETAEAPADAPVTAPFGTMSAARPADLDQTSGKFRLAILGDFSGRASRGMLETGPGLANRKPIKFDIDNLDSVIGRFSTTLVLPIGEDGAGIEVKLNSLDDLHPDELYENVALFEELQALRRRVAKGDGTGAIAELRGWADDFGHLALTSRKRAKGNAVPADRRLSEFQTLIGDMQGQLTNPSPVSELIGRVVGPYIQAAPDPAQDSMLAAIDDALSGAMRAILHHPDFQTVEATWRSLELLARRIETGAGLEIVLYDVSAEEWASDLSAHDDLAESGLFQMLAEEPRLDEAQGPLSAVLGLYTLEETPPHAELLARMAKISAWMNAPFLTAISPQFLETPKEDRHPLVSKTWDALRALPEARYVSLAAPRFLLRLPYGPKTEPVDPFDFEEFNLRSGLKGMLWANPVVLSAILMAKTVSKSGKKMRLGEVMSLDNMPFHYMTDQYDDQIALPCTERLLNTRTSAEVIARGFIPVLSMKGRNEVRQGSFQSLAGSELAGSWGPAEGKPSGTESTPAAAAQETGDNDDDGALELPDGDSSFDADLLAGGDSDSISEDDPTSDDGDLDALLAGFDDEDGSDNNDDELDPELAALLEGL